jgi:hypothetical protein
MNDQKSYKITDSENNDYIKDLIIPDYVIQELNKSFHNKKSDHYNNFGNFFPIWNEKINEFLIKNFPIFTNENIIYNINNIYKIVFNWNNQIFYISS